ncbi:hypothetical protein K439DRAFT_1360758 [Ramaria rubella]|nr:hypothetical protein K439DRAFT_1360758 [Ramaria rubella]
MATLDLTLGALVLGSFVSTALYGIIAIQLYLYAAGNFQDPLWLRVVVSFWHSLQMILETAHTIMLWVLIYTLTVSQYGRLDAIAKDKLLVSIAFPLAGLIGSIVQSFFAYRIRVLSSRNVIPVIAWCGALARTGFGLALCIMPLGSATIQAFLNRFLWVALTPMILNVAVDVLNTVSLCYYLLRGRSKFRTSKRMIDKLVVYTVGEHIGMYCFVI